MKVLWERGPSTVQEVQRLLAERRELAYTTVQTMLNVLQRKGKVRRTREERAHRYAPAVSRKKETSRAMRDVLDRFFGGSAENLVMNLLETRRLTPVELERLRRQLGPEER